LRSRYEREDVKYYFLSVERLKENILLFLDETCHYTAFGRARGEGVSGGEGDFRGGGAREVRCAWWKTMWESSRNSGMRARNMDINTMPTMLLVDSPSSILAKR